MRGSPVPFRILSKNWPDKRQNVQVENYKRLNASLWPTNSNGLISQEEIRARHRREKRQQEQMNFQRNVKRHMRANVKRQGRASLKAELTLFG
ncbi:hypothetical protein CLF_103681 [Clonorchis sinensis]|uniref:Uncharacterized protein n=1 Tax=Clonorchis sinensis TaxID=79923 RepID=G7YA70_CLOSI|nr:hypothetical protein CLF_103681 [Clonorchis sinensis]